MNTISDEELLEWIQEFHDENGKLPTTADANRSEVVTLGVYRSRFGSWNEAIELAGFKPRRHRYATDELLDWIHVFVATYGVVPTSADFREMEPLPSPETYRRHFGSFIDAVEKCGYTPRSRR